MVSKYNFILGCLFGLFIITGLASSIYAGDIAYIYKSRTDKNVLNFFSDKGISVDMIKESSLPKDLSGYKMIFIGDENFASDILIDKYPTVLMNHYIVKKLGLVSSSISQLVSTSALEVNYKGNQVQVYTSARDSKGISIPYYYLARENIAESLDPYLGTYSTSSGSDFGVVSALGSSGDKLLNDNILENNLCFFGIAKTDYWTAEAKDFFDNCVKYVYDYTFVPPVNKNITCNKDSDCGINKLTGSSFCLNNSVFQNYVSFKCTNPGTVESSCSSKTNEQLIKSCSLGCSNAICVRALCYKNIDCNDGNSQTEDVCNNPGTLNASCVHNIYKTSIKLISFVATPGFSTVTLNFSAQANGSLIKGYLVSKDKINWTFIKSPSKGYVFDGLSPSTNYLFFAKAVDSNDINTEEMNVSVRTLDLPANNSTNNTDSGNNEGNSGSGGGSGGSGGGGFTYCSTEWQCSEWGPCSSGKQARKCSVPAGMCTPATTKPSESQTCTESLSTSSLSNEKGNEKEKTNPKDVSTAPITGAAIANGLGKYSWLGAIIVLVAIAGGYFLVRRFSAAKPAE